MHRLARRTWFLLVLALLAVPLIAAALAYGCTALATLKVDPGAARPGATVTIEGRGFGTHDPTRVGTNGPAEIRLGSPRAPVLATAAPAGADRRFTVEVTVPPSFPPGETVFLATQKTATGTDVYGTPARQAFLVTAPADSAGAASAGAGGAAPPNVFQQIVESQVARQKADRLRTAIRRCKRKYSRAKAKRATGRKRAVTGKRIAKRRAACLKRARARNR